MGDKRTHSRFGGSIAARWLNCAGSVGLNDKLTPAPSDDYADEGNAAHSLAYQSLSRGVHPVAFLGKTMPGFPKHPVTQAMCDAVVYYLNVVETEIARSQTSIAQFEREFQLDVPGAEPGEIFGANDCLVYHPELKRLRVFDYKHGYQPVDVEDNSQLKFYALGALTTNPDWKVREIVLTIVAPNAANAYDAESVVKDWTFPLVDILEFAVDVENAVKRAKDVEKNGSGRDIAFNIGPWCDATRCTAKAACECPAVLAAGYKAATMDFGPMKAPDLAEIKPDMLPPVEEIDMDRLVALAEGVEFLSTWANMAKSYVERLIMAGAKHPKLKIVETQARAKWISDPQKIAGYADMMFGLSPDQTMPPKLLTITDMVAALKAAGASKDDIDAFKLKFTVKESSGRAVVPASDRRPAVDPAADFEGVNTTALIAAE